jgi:hypothetical protein
MVFLKVADDGLDGGPPFELALICGVTSLRVRGGSKELPMIESSHHFSSNVHQAYVNAAAGSYFMTATMYVRAASRLVAGDEIPRLTLLLFALELALKAYLVDVGTPDRALRRPNVRHDLRELSDLASNANLNLANAELAAVINDYRQEHKDHFFRYGARGHADLKDFDRAVCAVPDAVEKIGKLLKRRL